MDETKLGMVRWDSKPQRGGRLAGQLSGMIDETGGGEACLDP